GHLFCDASELADLTRVAPFVNHSNQQKQRSRAQTMVYHLQHAAMQTLSIEYKHSYDNKSQMAHTRIGNEFLDVRLNHCYKGAVDNSDQSQRNDDRRQFLRHIRE